MLELGQVHAGMLDIQARVGLGEKWATLSPPEAVALGHYATLQELQRDSNAEMLAALQSKVSSATLFSTIVWAPSHFTYLEARRATTSDPWVVYYQDSLPAQSAACYETAARVARAVGIVPANKPLVHSSEGGRRMLGAVASGRSSSWKPGPGSTAGRPQAHHPHSTRSPSDSASGSRS